MINQIYQHGACDLAVYNAILIAFQHSTEQRNLAAIDPVGARIESMLGSCRTMMAQLESVANALSTQRQGVVRHIRYLSQREEAASIAAETSALLSLW